MNKQKIGRVFLYALAAVYVIGMYSYPVLFYISLSSGARGSEITIDLNGWIRGFFMVLPLILGTVNLIAVLICRKLDRSCFLNCTLIIKYLLLPFYLFGGLCVVLAWLILFIPVPGVNFLGPIIGTTLAVMGYAGLIGAAPFSLTYIVRAGQDKTHPVWLCVLSGCSQFVFTLDVISIMILSLKEGKGRFAAIAALGLVVLFVLIILYFIIA